MLRNPLYLYGPSDPLVPGHLNFGDFVLEKLRGYNKDKIALIDASTDESILYSEIFQHAMNFAVSLTRMGVRKGDVIGLMSENRNEYWGAVIGATCTGAAVAMISPSYMQEELKNALNISKPKILICSPTVYKTHSKRLHYFPYLEKVIVFGNERLESIFLYNDLVVNNIGYEDFKSADVNGQTDTLFIVYSSGTTGMPKGVMLTHLNVILACCLPVSHDPAAMTFSIPPWYHVMGLVGFLAGIIAGRTAVYLPKFNVEVFLNAIQKYKIQQLALVPPVLVAISKYPGKHDLSSVKLISSGAAPLTKETLIAVHKKFPNLYAVLQGYGSSEITLASMKFMLTEAEVAKRKPGSVGSVVHGFTVKVVDIETRKPLGPNQKGEICVKGAMLMKGYVGGNKGTDFDEEGFYKMGDIGYYDEDGFFYIVDRLKELIKYKGHQVPPAELESLILTHPAVKDVGVIGIPHKTAGEVPMAFVELQNGMRVTEKELQDFVAERMSSPKHLRGGMRLVPKVPKSPSGKILRKELRQLYRTGSSKL